jgi:hypothetical protein
MGDAIDNYHFRNGRGEIPAEFERQFERLPICRTRSAVVANALGHFIVTRGGGSDKEDRFTRFARDFLSKGAFSATRAAENQSQAVGGDFMGHSVTFLWN